MTIHGYRSGGTTGTPPTILGCINLTVSFAVPFLALYGTCSIADSRARKICSSHTFLSKSSQCLCCVRIPLFRWSNSLLPRLHPPIKLRHCWFDAFARSLFLPSLPRSTSTVWDSIFLPTPARPKLLGDPLALRIQLVPQFPRARVQSFHKRPSCPCTKRHMSFRRSVSRAIVPPGNDVRPWDGKFTTNRPISWRHRRRHEGARDASNEACAAS
mmetsp:Transcript_2032/g.13085  ORF Transcript_2032/g.13085 Transcript_2032/m.13085 type:complete len:214 (+) Transcript_2032:1088-1729(+)